MSIEQQKYTIEITAPGIIWKLQMESEEDIKILEAVFKKLLRDSLQAIDKPTNNE